MKIAFVTASISRRAGGLHESVRRLAQSLSNSASYVQAFTLRDDYTEADRACWDPVPIIAFPCSGPSQFGFAPAMAEALAGSDANLVMSHGLWMYPSVATNRWHAKTRRPYILHPHGMLDDWAVRNSRMKKRIAAVLYEHKHLQNAACIRALCQSEARSIRAYGLKNPICIIPNGIDLPPADAESHTEPCDPPLPIDVLKASGQNLLLYLGRIHPKKGLIHLLHAWSSLRSSPSATLHRQVAPWTLAIAGWDQNGHEAELKRLASELDIPWIDARTARAESRSSNSSQESLLKSRLVFLGPQFGSNKAACYRNCDAFVLPSHSEGLPMVILEAWAYGKPVVMTPECNLPEGFRVGAALRVSTGAAGAHPQHKSMTLAEGLQRLLEMSVGERIEMGTQGQALVTQKFSWSRIGREMKSVYEWVLNGGPIPESVSVYT